MAQTFYAVMHKELNTIVSPVDKMLTKEEAEEFLETQDFQDQLEIKEFTKEEE